MKRVMLMISMAGMLLVGGLNSVVAQDDMPSAAKDSVNADQAAKPQFYDAEEQKEAPKSDGTTYAMIAGAVVVLGAAGYFLTRKKKN